MVSLRIEMMFLGTWDDVADAGGILECAVLVVAVMAAHAEAVACRQFSAE